MKFAVVIIFMTLSIPVFSQSTEKTQVPEVIEDSRIDSLLDKYLTSRVPDEKTCLTIDIRLYSNEYTFFLGLVKTPLSVVNLYGHYNNLRYFMHKGFIVFVWGEVEPYHIFASTKKRRKFRFEASIVRAEELMRNKQFLGLYVYSNNKFENVIKKPSE